MCVTFVKRLKDSYWIYVSHNDSSWCDDLSLTKDYDGMIVFTSNEQMEKTFLEISLKEYTQDACIYKIWVLPV